MEAPASHQQLQDPTITLKISGRLSHHTGHPDGSGVKILMCHISLAQVRNAVVQWRLPGSVSAIFWHNPGCKSSCGTTVHANVHFPAIYMWH
jgi:hypothetical protein